VPQISVSRLVLHRAGDAMTRNAILIDIDPQPGTIQDIGAVRG
jgi:hypothetical protein